MSELTTVLPRGVAAVERSVGSLPEPLAAELVDAVRRLDTEDAVFLANLDEAIVEIVELLDECPVGVTAECLRKRLLLVVPEPVKARYSY